MNVRWVGTAEAAARLGVTEMTIRRWAKAGRLPSRRMGRRLVVDLQAASGAAPGVRRDEPPFRLAVRKVLSGRRLNEWLPDAAQYRDVQEHPENVVDQVRTRWLAGDLEGRDIDYLPIPKGHYNFRPGSLLRLDDEVLYASLVLAAQRPIELSLGPEVYSYRMASSRSADLLKHQGTAWGRFQQVQREAAKAGWTHALVADIAGFYEYINEDVLADGLIASGVTATTGNAIRALIKGWRKRNGLGGLPQGPDSSAVLANAYLVPVDEEMVAEAHARGWRYLRWSDDIRVFTKSEDEARQAAYLLSMALRRRGLYLAPAKTTAVSTSALAATTAEGDLGEIAYLFGRGGRKRVAVRLGEVFQKATDRGKRLSEDKVTELRFALYRLGAIRDRRALKLVLRELPLAGFVAHHVYLYLRAFLDRAAVIDRVVDVLGTLDPHRDGYLAGQLLRLLAEAPSLPPSAVQEARRWAWEIPAPAPTRAVAIRAIGQHGQTRDEAIVRTRLWRESNERVVRALLVSLKAISPDRSRATLGDYKRSFPEARTLVDYLYRHPTPTPR